MTEDSKVIRKIMSAGSLEAPPGAKDDCGAGVDMDAKYLRAIRKSSLARWTARYTAKPMPVPKISAEDGRQLTLLVDEIIEAKTADPDADTWYLEIQIDDLVYDLYGLSEEETTKIERGLGLIHQTDEEEDAAFLKILERDAAADDADDFVSEEGIMAILRGADDT